jgi:hypothetical protein
MPYSTYIGNVTKEMYQRERKRRSPPETCESRQKAQTFFAGKRKEKEKWRDTTQMPSPTPKDACDAKRRPSLEK